MAADNANIIALIAANFTPKNRNQTIMYGVLATFFLELYLLYRQLIYLVFL